MSAFVLDNSVTMRWLLPSKKTEDQQYAIEVLKTIAWTRVLVPNLWQLEVINVLLNAQKRGDALPGICEDFLSQLENLPITTDELTPVRAFSRTYGFAAIYGLSSYDAAYLELAIREGVPLATLDKALAKAAVKAGVDLYLAD